MGNTIENSNNIQGNATLDFTKLYNNVPYLKNLNSSSRRNNSGNQRGNNQRGEKDKSKGGKDDEGDQVADSTKTKPKVNYGKIVLDNSLRLLTMVKKVSGTYSLVNGQTLPGFMPKPDYFGMNVNGWSPGVGFVFGSSFGEDADIYNKAVAHSIEMAEAQNWLTYDSILADPYRRQKTEAINYRVNAEPFQGFKIDITGQRNYAENYQHYFRFSPETRQFEVFTPTNGGSFNSSYFMMH